MHQVLLPSSRWARMRNAWRRPEQAALAARIPIARDRVPMRWYWRRRSPDLEFARPDWWRDHLPVDRMSAAAGWSRARTGEWLATRRARRLRQPDFRDLGLRVRVRPMSDEAHGAPAALVVAAASRAEAGRAQQHALMPAGMMGWALGVLALATAVGAAMMFYLDPQSGRRRRALARDRVVHVERVMGHAVPHRLAQRGRFVRGRVRGVTHRITSHNGHAFPVDDETLVARVRSEVLREERISAGEINIDAYEGCVTLRGQLPDTGGIRYLVSATRHVDGVREVRSFLHLPDELPPNKAEVYELAEHHLPSI